MKKQTADETLDSVTDLLAEVGITPREQPKSPAPASPPPAVKTVVSPVSFRAPSATVDFAQQQPTLSKITSLFVFASFTLSVVVCRGELLL